MDHVQEPRLGPAPGLSLTGLKPGAEVTVCRAIDLIVVLRAGQSVETVVLLCGFPAAVLRTTNAERLFHTTARRVMVQVHVGNASESKRLVACSEDLPTPHVLCSVKQKTVDVEIEPAHNHQTL